MNCDCCDVICHVVKIYMPFYSPLMIHPYSIQIKVIQYLNHDDPLIFYPRFVDPTFKL